MRQHAPAQQLPLQLSVEASADLAQALTIAQGEIEALKAELATATQQIAKLTAKVERLKRDKKSWDRSYKLLKRERDALYQAALTDTTHPLHLECTRLRIEVDTLRQTLRQQFERWMASGQAGDLGTDDVKRLLARFHPDRWSQGQPATALSHEICVELNALRKKGGVA